MPDSSRTEALKKTFADRYARLERSKKGGPLVATGKRFFEIDGLTYGGLLAIELFTTVLPLIILGYSYLSGFSDNASLGVLLARQFNLDGDSAEVMRAAFGSSSGLQSTWTVLGVLGFVVWGIPMSITVAGMFAKAWRREQYDIGGRLWRGLVWFVLYLVTIGVRERISASGHLDWLARVPLFLVSMIPMWLFWSLSPVLLVRDGGRGRRSLFLAGLAGVIIDGVVMGIAVRIAFPILLDGWTQFGPIGVAMTLMTWCGVIGIAWVVTACMGAIIWERHTAAETVLEAQTAVPDELLDEQDAAVAASSIQSGPAAGNESTGGPSEGIGLA